VVDDQDLDAAVRALRAGRLVAFPTETVYGLGCDAENPEAVARCFAVKGRPADHPVIVHLPGRDALEEWGRDLDPVATILADACWPGPLTLVVRRSGRVLDAVTGGRDTVGVRVPEQPIAAALLMRFGSGIAAPSANRFGRVSPTTAADVRADLGSDVDVVLDGGPSAVGVESTIVDTTGPGPRILRLGAVPRERIAVLLGRPVELAISGEVAAPGVLPAHYAPRARVIVVDAATVARRGEPLLASGARVGVLAPLPLPSGLPRELVVLDPPRDVDEYAHVLYARLRDADRLGLDVLLAVPPGCEGVGAAVADRLQRASRAS
jgi:L-threonylcarbamoyladenylate synthase